MNKYFLLSIIMLFAGSNLFAQKKQKPVVLKTAEDTIAYAYGAALTRDGMMQALYQMKVLSDTTTVSTTYNAKISQETDPVKQNELRKEKAFKIDSINAQNKKSLPEFIKGFTEAYNATKKDKQMYMKGISFGSQTSEMIPMASSQFLGENNGTFDKKILLSGIMDALNGNDLVIENPSELVRKKSEETKIAEAATRNKKVEQEYAEVKEEGTRFLEANAERPEVKRLPIGLQYEVLTEGTGAKPQKDDRVKVHYTGSLIDGTVFDSSVQRGEPLEIGVSQVIQGWTEALKLMPVGSKWKLYIPYDLAYGATGAGPIKPYSTLIFEVELLDIVK
ncbi:FKBP-type peptidyl-prolyl cis-trans isomerase [Dysgonomonas sp. 216]|uniref:FKBP-type peptidyl-prolyl cis-trans isomerase n=1 Tax=Dysgonomonas sp. 216 TaxID=2302934 RepID=UPI0013D6148E|nr:FKBP-type peptidyl-prolyl cis-trans isomerase [Dysgonomonas sp. 216]NDW19850.1 FKBP-type peptidyl-prolyl cis-trans isomerase [Dysgonomonas sp. 216]